VPTSRERVMMAVDHQEPDRIPLDLDGHRCSGIMAIAYNQLEQHLGIKTGDIYVYDFIQQLAIVEPEVLDRFGVDTIDLGRGFALSPEDWHDWVLPDETPCKIPAFIHPVRIGRDWHVCHQDGTLIAIQKEGCLYVEQTHFPLGGSNDSSFDEPATHLDKMMWAALGTPPAPIGYDDEGMEKLVAGASALRRSTDKAIIGHFGGSLMESGQLLFGMADFFTLMAAEPARTHRFLDRLLEVHLANLERFLSALGPYIDIVVFSDDLGMQTGAQVSTPMYYEFFQPRHKVMWETVKTLSDVKIMLHSCGGVGSLLPGLIEAGLDIIQPVQTSARGMEAERIKREYGKDICLWGGGCDTQHVLPRGTPEEVAADVRQRVGVFSPGGGFVFQQIHNIMADVPSENIVAMLDAVNS
jgi:uroporphyrinogen decarboxylase